MGLLKNSLPFVLSILTHLSVVALLISSTAMSLETGGEHSGGSVSKEIIPKVVEFDFVHPDETSPIEDGDIEQEAPKAPQEGVAECPEDSWYGGIGLTIQWANDVVSSISEGYPAHKAGILVGDRIISSNGKPGSEIRGEPGTEVVVEIYRESTGQTLTFRLIRDKICTVD